MGVNHYRIFYRIFRLCTKLQKGDDSNLINKIKAQIKINEDNFVSG
jgi:hypothetical protein